MKRRNFQFFIFGFCGFFAISAKEMTEARNKNAYNGKDDLFSKKRNPDAIHCLHGHDGGDQRHSLARVDVIAAVLYFPHDAHPAYLGDGRGLL